MAVDACPECGVDITAMDAQAFADHMHDAHPDTWALFKRVFDSFAPNPEGEASRDLRDAIASAACEPLRAPEPRGKT
jgi:hypothetical protein